VIVQGRNPLLRSLLYAFLGLYAVVILYPLFFLVTSSLKDDEELFLAPWSLPRNWNLWGYYDVLVNYGVGRYLLNSLYYATMSVAISLVVCSMGAYALVRMKWRLSGAALGFFLMGLMVPVHAMIVPLYLFVTKVGLSNPRITLVSIFVAFTTPTTIFILAGYMKGIPRELEESAVIDGCSLKRAFWAIVMPMMQPALATVAIFNFLNVWNDFLISLIFINDDRYWPIQLGISRFQGSFQTRYSYLLTAIIIAIIPSAIVYIVLNKRIVSGLAAGAIKG
jgi:raffinose/stachyose/melibiose transport system permease protein